MLMNGVYFTRMACKITSRKEDGWVVENFRCCKYYLPYRLAVYSSRRVRVNDPFICNLRRNQIVYGYINICYEQVL